MQKELTQETLPANPGLLTPQGRLAQVGWSRQPLLDCNLEAARVAQPRFWQPMRMKRWDYYGLTTPTHFYSFTLAHLGYAGQVFAYAIDLNSGEYHEETVTVPLGVGVSLPRNSEPGLCSDPVSKYTGKQIRMVFETEPGCRKVELDWPDFGKKALEKRSFSQNPGFSARLTMTVPENQESMVIVIPIGKQRFYYNRKVNCLPASGWVEVAGKRVEIDPLTCLGNLDWGRGAWEYRSFWVWASASGFLPDQRRIGLNLGFGFGDTSAATENAIILDGRIHKLGPVDFTYDNQSFKRPWMMKSQDGRLDLTFTPHIERVARTDLKLIFSEVHQMFGHYSGRVVSDSGEVIELDGLTGFAEEHHARW